MRQSKTTSGERIVKDIKRKTRKRYSAEEKIRFVLDGFRGKVGFGITFAVRGNDHWSFGAIVGVS